MSDFPKVPQQPTAQVNMDFNSLEDMKCDQCGDLRFEQVFILKRVSALMSPSGKAGVMPVGVFACLLCGHINAEFIPQMKSSSEGSKEEVQKTSIELMD